MDRITIFPKLSSIFPKLRFYATLGVCGVEGGMYKNRPCLIALCRTECLIQDWSEKKMKEKKTIVLPIKL